jgi:hypothetical protein
MKADSFAKKKSLYMQRTVTHVTRDLGFFLSKHTIDTYPTLQIKHRSMYTVKEQSNW